MKSKKTNLHACKVGIAVQRGCPGFALSTGEEAFYTSGKLQFVSFFAANLADM